MRGAYENVRRNGERPGSTVPFAMTAAVAYSDDAVVYHRRQYGEELPQEEVLQLPPAERLGPDGREALGAVNPLGETHLDLTVLRREGTGGAGRSRRRRRSPLPDPVGIPGPGTGPEGTSEEKIAGSFLPAAGRIPGRKFELSRRPSTVEDWNEVLVVYAGALVEQRERDARRAEAEAGRLLGSVEEVLRYRTYDREDHPDLLRARELAPLLDENGLARLRRVEEEWAHRPLEGTEADQSLDGREEPMREEDLRTADDVRDDEPPAPPGGGNAYNDLWPEDELIEAEYPGADEDYEEQTNSSWLRTVGVVALVLLLLGGGFFTFRSFTGNDVAGSAQAESANDRPRDSESAASASAGKVVETGWVFEALPQKANGQVQLTAANADSGARKTWDGVIESGGDGGSEGAAAFDDLSLEGETFGNFRGGFAIPRGSLTNGSFATAIPGERVLHATYQQAREPGKNGLQVADGTYKVIDEPTGEILLSGTYSDQREPGSSEVVRQYRERSPGSSEWKTLRRSFEAPAETPIPLLVGNEEPAVSGD